MSNILYLQNMVSRKMENEKAAEKMREREAFRKAIENIKKTSGIDFFKVLMGDEEEKRKYEMKMRQAAMECDEDDE